MVRSDLITEGNGGAASLVGAGLPAALLLDSRAGWCFLERASGGQAFVYEELARGRDLKHYALRGVDRGAEADAGRPAYFESARRYPADAFAEFAPRHATAPLPEPLARATEAAHTVTAPERRAEPDARLDREAAGQPGEASASGPFAGVDGTLVMQPEAVAPGPRRSGWLGRLGQARAAGGDTPAGAPLRPGAYLVLGLMALRTGDEAQAERFPRQALELNPYDDQA